MLRCLKATQEKAIPLDVFRCVLEANSFHGRASWPCNFCKYIQVQFLSHLLSMLIALMVLGIQFRRNFTPSS